ncbi:putative beta-lysine N-acetyltransferase [Thermoactinomyces vulgaris]|jgi:beta-lysine N6-acetyltransferase|uniref:Beta-lysine N-acetyltransferase n=1 Tax=Thermoactinomyces vulgaris TaxID=2026 RepID=A0ABS0QGK1_THEVU|nr:MULTISPECIES: putative beta-lysine N-acetyltransferase [Thermoactinomyces]MBA4551852.1 putative beta-lysine N-acetyltransferase [Thermoactinomyces vulgaris]MBA4597183.1 putative beta-lysine N-acetyltransferase [Thermoactinomyces vulgaris]MBH8588325.1 putative beta-lysine N-acetyltransferase [Thermoactinomyces vulgaris]MBI0391954.1 putative beta-lysine N-acetyltransferase [Thermoactinomyces sp. CICC 24226]MCF6135404.1 putative beta-lysine N-acetyltransferase [Thermoactinomyces vulgaris]
MKTTQTTPHNVSYEVDEFNSRIKLIQYSRYDVESLLKHLEELAKEKDIGKVMIYANPEDISFFEKLGFQREGEISGFFQGNPACILSRFLEEDRAHKKDEEKKDQIVEMAEQAEAIKERPRLDPKYQLRHAVKEDAEALAKLYQLVFETYPTPIHDPDFIRQCMDQDVYFTVVTEGDQIVSSASADVFPHFQCAEITDCATHPDHRGNGLLSAIIYDLELRMKEKGIPHLFSLTRAVSTGMNMVIAKLGFEYKGRLIQNSQISGDFEDMNIWVKKL